MRFCWSVLGFIGQVLPCTKVELYDDVGTLFVLVKATKHQIMRLKRILGGLYLLILSMTCFSQKNAIDYRDFNIGLSTGVGAQHRLLLPSLDLSYRMTSLSVTPTLPYLSFTVTQGIYPVQIKNLKLGYVVASVNYVRKDDHFQYWYLRNFTNYDSDAFSLMAGFKFLFLKRFYASLQAGASYTMYRGAAANSEQPSLIFQDNLNNQFRFAGIASLGINLFKHYK